jgi:hypothetical protein
MTVRLVCDVCESDIPIENPTPITRLSSGATFCYIGSCEFNINVESADGACGVVDDRVLCEKCYKQYIVTRDALKKEYNENIKNIFKNMRVNNENSA